MEFLYCIFVIGWGIATVVNGQGCDTQAIAACSSGGSSPSCQTVSVLENCLMQHADTCSGNNAFEQMKGAITQLKTSCGASGDCNLLAVSACSDNVQNPTCNTIAATESCLQRYSADCSSNPSYMSMVTATTSLKQTLGCPGSNSGGGDACNVQAMGACYKLIQDKFGEGTTDFTPEMIKPACSTFLQFETCIKPTSCEDNMMVKAFLPKINDMCKPGGCPLAEVITCVFPLQSLGNDASMGLPKLDTASVEKACSVFKSVLDCLNQGDKLKKCDKNEDIKKMTGSINMVKEFHNYICTEKKDEIRKYKDCFDKPEVRNAAMDCFNAHLNDSFTKIAEATERPADSVLCNALNSNNDCMKEKMEGVCEDKQIAVYNMLSKEGMVNMQDIKNCPVDNDINGSSTVMATTVTVFFVGLIALLLL